MWSYRLLALLHFFEYSNSYICVCMQTFLQPTKLLFPPSYQPCIVPHNDQIHACNVPTHVTFHFWDHDSPWLFPSELLITPDNAWFFFSHIMAHLGHHHHSHTCGVQDSTSWAGDNPLPVSSKTRHSYNAHGHHISSCLHCQSVS